MLYMVDFTGRHTYYVGLIIGFCYFYSKLLSYLIELLYLAAIGW